MQSEALEIESVRGDRLPLDRLTQILALAKRAYGRDLSSYYYHFREPTHVIGYCGADIVSHALWVPRWLQVGDDLPLRTAYVEMVATEPSQQRRGFAVMRALIDAVHDYELAALCPSDQGVRVYERLGWRFWQGPLAIRTDSGVVPTPTEAIMFFVLPRTPRLDPTRPISAEWRPDDLW